MHVLIWILHASCARFDIPWHGGIAAAAIEISNDCFAKNDLTSTAGLHPEPSSSNLATMQGVTQAVTQQRPHQRTWRMLQLRLALWLMTKLPVRRLVLLSPQIFTCRFCVLAAVSWRSDTRRNNVSSTVFRADV